MEKIEYKKPEIMEIWDEDIAAEGIYLLEM
jgi:hypothetical protein